LAVSKTSAAQRPRTAKRVARRSPEVARQEIIDAAAYFLRQRPFREISIGDLMSHTKIGRSAFYVYFKDIYAVVEELVSGIRDQVLEYFKAWSATDLPPADAIRLFISDTVNLWAVDGPMIAAMVDASAGDERLERILAEVTSIYRRTVAGILREELAAGRIRDMDCEEMATALIIGTQAYLKARLGHTGRRDPLKVAATLQDLWIHAIYAA
jgi:AcrR family transcriptional regulator